VSVEVFRAQQTYELLIARHEPRGGEDGRRPQLSSQVLFRGTQGYLSLELWGKDREAAGRITPEFFDRSGERKEIQLRFAEAVKAAVKGATTINCREPILARAAPPANDAFTTRG
jgi:hypothetical protein